MDFLPPPAVNASLTRLSLQLADGVLRPLPQAVHMLSAVQAALRQMSQARHVGKIVVRAPSGEPAKAAPAGTVVITGGLGSLGSLTAAWLSHSNRQLHVRATGRTGRFTSDVSTVVGSSASLAALVASGFDGMLSMTSADSATAEDAALLLSTSSAGTPVVGMLHASGVLADATLRNQTAAGIRTTWAPKASALHQMGGAYGRQPGTFQLLFSSIAALLGSPGQANYSAANATLDVMSQAAQAQVRCIAALRCRDRCRRPWPRPDASSHCWLPCHPLLLQGLASISVQWGAWAGGGMAGHDASTRARVERTGLGLVEIPAGLAALEGLLLQSAAAAPMQAAAVPIRWPRFLQQQFKAAPPPMFAAFADQAGPAATTAAAAPRRMKAAQPARQKRRSRRPAPSSAAAPDGKSAAEHGAFMLQQVQDAVSAVLGSADIDPQQPLMEAGLDSLSSVELKNSLEARLGTELPSTLVFDYPTMAALAGFLAAKIRQPGDAAAASASGSDSEGSTADLASAEVHHSSASRRCRRRPHKMVAAADTESHRALMLQQVQEAVAAVLGSADIDAQQPLMEAGLDSLSSVELKNSLEAKLGAELPSTLVFDYPTMAALAGFLAAKIQPGAAAASASELSSYGSEASYGWESEDEVPAGRRALAPAQRARQVVTVTGWAVRAPADAFAGLEPVDAVRLVPASRWDLEANAGGCGGRGAVAAAPTKHA